jgi:hypothetical protein
MQKQLIKQAKFLIKELSAVLKLLELDKESFTDELKEEMRNLSQTMINVLL